MSRNLLLLLVLAGLLGLAAAAGILSVPVRTGELGVLGETITSPPRGLRDLVLGLGVLVLGAWIFGELLSVVRLPRICGYLLFGVLVGPDAATWRPDWFPDILGSEQLAYVKLVDGLAIAVIAFVAGGEIRLGELRAIAAKVAGIVGLHAVVVFSGMALVTSLVILPMVPGLAGEDGEGPGIVPALIVGTIAMAISPAVLIAVIKDARARGPVSRISLTSAIMVDLVLITTFTVLMFAVVRFGGGEGGGDLLPLAGGLAWHLLGSVLVGGVIGGMILWISRAVPEQLDALVLLAAFGIAVIGEFLHVAPLLVGLSAGIAQANLAGHNADLERSAERLLLPVCCVFFAVAGAGVHLGDLPSLWPAVLVIVGCRAALITGAAGIGTRLVGFDPPVRRWLWACFISQAGLSIALVGEVRRNLPDAAWAGELATLLLAVITIHELVGPLLMRFGLAKAGEVDAVEREHASESAGSTDSGREVAT
ncbi:MAG: cation:proton antiporter [Phycisphaerales bacterium]|nr:cation:proton antiporter [Planctomycetota bacterium]